MKKLFCRLCSNLASKLFPITLFKITILLFTCSLLSTLSIAYSFLFLNAKRVQGHGGILNVLTTEVATNSSEFVDLELYYYHSNETTMNLAEVIEIEEEFPAKFRKANSADSDTHDEVEISSNQMLAVFDVRRQLMENVCQQIKRQNSFNSNYFSLRHSNRKPWISYKSFHGQSTGSLNRIQLDWCPIFKAASSPWMAVFAKLHGALTSFTETGIKRGRMTFVKLAKDTRMSISPPKQRRLHETLPSLDSYDESNSSLKLDRLKIKDIRTYYQMIVLRHPFERILSAYRDKFERIQGREFYHRKYGYKIVEMFRDEAPSQDFYENSGENKKILRDQLLRKLIKRVLENHQQSPNNASLLSLKLDYTPPSFHEFIQYLLSSGPSNPASMDEHWRPMYLDCPPCLNSFSLILKVETMTRDKAIVFKLLGFGNRTQEYGELSSVWNRWANKSGAEHLNQTNHKNTLAKKYFPQIPRADLVDLYELYKPDFDLFNYSADEYLEMGK